MLVIESSIKPIEIFFNSTLDDDLSSREFIADSLQTVVKNFIFLDRFDDVFKYFTLNENIKILIVEVDKDNVKDVYYDLLNIQSKMPTLLLVQENDTDTLNFLVSLGFNNIMINKISKDILLSKVNLMYTLSQNQVDLEKSQRQLEKLNKKLENKIDIIENNREKIEDSSKEKELFIANISHEIRTPLNAMMGFVELLKDTKLNDKQLNYIDTISYSSKNLINILNDVLDYSKIESNSLQIEDICMNIFDTLSEVVNLFGVEASNKGIGLNLIIDENVPENIKSDPTRIKQIISNLVSNSIKFTLDGDIDIIVKILNNADGRFVEFAVKDTGIGISAEEQKKIFNEFEQANETISRKYGGTGLGLSISTKLASLLDSSIQLQSKIGVGSKFYFKIPVQECAVFDTIDDTQEIQFNKDKKILIAEDIGTNAKLMKEIFANIGLDVDIAKNGEEAFNMYLKNGYDIIFMDINMPVEDGLKATFKILAHERKNCLENTPIIALTANALREDRDNYLMSGMDDYLVKPVSKEKIIGILNEYL
jgi:signal transduction histidine kinase/ActR/RegA family two-component response regulator